MHALTFPVMKDLFESKSFKLSFLIAKVKSFIGVMWLSRYSVYLLSTISKNGIVCRAKAQVGVRAYQKWLLEKSCEEILHLYYYQSSSLPLKLSVCEGPLKEYEQKEKRNDKAPTALLFLDLLLSAINF